MGMYNPNNLLIGAVLLFLIGYAFFIIRRMYRRKIRILENQINNIKQFESFNNSNIEGDPVTLDNIINNFNCLAENLHQNNPIPSIRINSFDVDMMNNNDENNDFEEIDEEIDEEYNLQINEIKAKYNENEESEENQELEENQKLEENQELEENQKLEDNQELEENQEIEENQKLEENQELEENKSIENNIEDVIEENIDENIKPIMN